MSLSRFLALPCLLLSAAVFAQTLGAAQYNVGVLDKPVAVVQDPTNPSVQFIVQQWGTVWAAVNGVVQPQPFIQVSTAGGGAGGLLSMCFDPGYATNRFFYLTYTQTGIVQLSRFSRSASDPLKGDPLSELHVLRTIRPYEDHNAGTVHFGVDGMLYIPTGDGGNPGDPDNRAQDPLQLLGKMLRIDPRTDSFPADPEKNYSVPIDNPFLDGQPIVALPEIWSFGLRNPWKWAFDDWTKLGTGAMVVADVGESQLEEVDYEPAGIGGRNYGWSRYEGTAIFRADRQLAYGPHTEPILEYGRSLGISITGGFVYRGLGLGPESFGRYFYADWVGNLWSAGLDVDPQTGEATVTDVMDHTAELGLSLGRVVSIDPDHAGEILVSDYMGSKVFRVFRRNSTWLTDVDRADGIITAGQVRSLILSDQKLLTVAPFSPVFTTTKKTTTLIGFKTNTASQSLLNFEVTMKVSQNLSVPTVVKVKNWATGFYDQIATFTTGGSFATRQASAPALDHVRADGRIELRVETVYTGPLLGQLLATQFDSASAEVQ